MLLIYTHKITPRLTYVFKHMCTRILGIPVDFTTTVEDFIAHHDGLKMSYTKQPLSKELFVSSNDLLFEQGLNDIEINVHDWDGTKAFFPTSEKSHLPFDIFAASFYLLSRYEEYLPHVKDEFGRFTASESLAFKNGFLHQPVVDIWAYKLKRVLQEQFPEYQFPKKQYSIKPVIDIPSPYHYRLKGFMRTLGGTLRDLVGLKLKQVYERYAVLLGLRHDPYDTFKYIINKQKRAKNKFQFFFLIGDYSTYDKGINIQKRKYVSLIKQVSDYCDIGLKVSYFAMENEALLKAEKKRMENVVNTALTASRNSFSKLNLPDTYRHLTALEIHNDFSMGYTNTLGFRAGTCTPFFFYDLDYEIQTPLKIHSYHVLDYALLKHHSLLDKKQALERIMEEVKQVNGQFVPIFHNYAFGTEPQWYGYKELFNTVLKSMEE